MRIYLLLVILMLATIISPAWSSDFSVALLNDYGGFESRAGASLDPPGYPDGQGNSLYNREYEEPYQSHIALDIDEVKYVWATHSAPVYGQTWTTHGFIWSGPEDSQQAINIKWQSVPEAYNWRLKIFSLSGTLLRDINVLPKEGNNILRGDFTLPILQTSNWREGYPFQIEVNTVPEHGSLLALGSGFAGLIGFGLRRRRS